MYQRTYWGIKRISDGALIPHDLKNRDWNEFQNWCANGNEPLPLEQHSVDDLKKLEDNWASQQLSKTDRCLTPDYPTGTRTREEHTAIILEYRAKLRNPSRSNHPDYPNESWRPEWPEGVKLPAQ
ncbi:hypothetical protein [Sansalvadorimonas verongulae]|uniref:hypothetical protein n=1 Tax=Sansalvadorimonas verongulae TaxID=2172824 RepID=UPI0012BC5F66|nr:hypothetical protein [Sansalvadorimonas verongulae]MTI12627.1 hypothetical protein [Sansalvadorimonas verongulae]